MLPGKHRWPQKRGHRPFRINTFRALWYVTVFCEQVEEERTFRPDRISSFRLIKQPLVSIKRK
ncbi:MAG: WYL domain-containing protein [bacterium]|nr:WYL domain-containing protein [bacterium]